MLKNQVRDRTMEATLVACMSQYLARKDLQGEANVNPSRIRVLANAVPQEIHDAIDNDPGRLPAPLSDGKPYLFYPAAFRTYKNHRLLVEALPRLKEIGLEEARIVFTGIRELPPWLRDSVEKQTSPTDIVLLGKVTREELVRLYRHAYATVVPSLYEQGSFPVVEALTHRCPAVCSDIPQLREQFASMGDAMIYFDPHSIDSLLTSLSILAQNRGAWLERQMIAFRALRSRTWTVAARDWIAILHEAVGLRGFLWEEKSSVGPRPPIEAEGCKPPDMWRISGNSPRTIQSISLRVLTLRVKLAATR